MLQAREWLPSAHVTAAHGIGQHAAATARCRMLRGIYCGLLSETKCRWGIMKEWLKVGSLPDDNELSADLKAVDYGYDASDAILLERKDDMWRRGLASPDDGDALALTFAYPVAKRDWAEERRFDEALQKLKRWVV